MSGSKNIKHISKNHCMIVNVRGTIVAIDFEGYMNAGRPTVWDALVDFDACEGTHLQDMIESGRIIVREIVAEPDCAYRTVEHVVRNAEDVETIIGEA